MAPRRRRGVRRRPRAACPGRRPGRLVRSRRARLRRGDPGPGASVRGSAAAARTHRAFPRSRLRHCAGKRGDLSPLPRRSATPAQPLARRRAGGGRGEPPRRPPWRRPAGVGAVPRRARSAAGARRTGVARRAGPGRGLPAGNRGAGCKRRVRRSWRGSGAGGCGAADVRDGRGRQLATGGGGAAAERRRAHRLGHPALLRRAPALPAPLARGARPAHRLERRGSRGVGHRPRRRHRGAPGHRARAGPPLCGSRRARWSHARLARAEPPAAVPPVRGSPDDLRRLRARPARARRPGADARRPRVRALLGRARRRLRHRSGAVRGPVVRPPEPGLRVRPRRAAAAGPAALRARLLATGHLRPAGRPPGAGRPVPGAPRSRPVVRRPERGHSAAAW